jgi:hypothetical protein
MDKIYAQVINGTVNLVGGEELGLPLERTAVTSIDITSIPEELRPKVGWFYEDGMFSETNDFIDTVPDLGRVLGEFIVQQTLSLAELNQKIDVLTQGITELLARGAV